METKFKSNSSAFTRIGYDPETRRLRVWFRKKDIWESESDPYTHYRLPEELAMRFINATSQGTFYANHIRGRFGP